MPQSKSSPKTKHIPAKPIQQNPDALRREVHDMIEQLSKGDAAFEQESHGLLRVINTSLIEGEDAVKKVERTFRSSTDPLAEKIDKAIEEFVGEE